MQVKAVQLTPGLTRVLDGMRPRPLAPQSPQPPAWSSDRLSLSPRGGASVGHEAIVKALYQTLLGREPDAVGLADFTARLEAGASVASLAEAITSSYEYRHRQTVLGLYRGLLGREPDAPGYADYMQRLKDGASLHEIRKGFLESPEFQARPATGGYSDMAWVTGLYWGLLGRAPDAGGLAAHTGGMRQGWLTRPMLLDAFLSCPEFKATLPPPPPPPPAPPRPQAPYISQLHPAGADWRYTNGPNNCGPATMAMIGRAYGFGSGLSDAGLIMQLERAGGTTAAGTGVDGIARMARHMGLRSELRGPRAEVGWIAEQVRAGKLVAANGNYYAMDPHRDAGAVAQGRGGHYVAVVGMDEAGNFQVHDPFHDNGGRPLTLTPRELAEYINANRNGGWQIAVGA